MFPVITKNKPVFSRIALPETTPDRKVRLRVATPSQPLTPAPLRYRLTSPRYQPVSPQHSDNPLAPRAPLPKMILDHETKSEFEIPLHYFIPVRVLS
ncbi:hypothetical protein [Gimesia sp.]|uniref:hypothetical protein n=1 Tax=Gimesia sp. TaxID=2024833 RepID=UPI003A8E49A9